MMKIYITFLVIHKPCSIEESLNQVSTIPKSVIKLEKFYDLKDKFKGARNCKTNSSTMQYEVINLGTEHNHQCVNLGSTCTPQEKTAFIRLFNEFKDIFSWTYDDLKTFDPNIMQHVIPMKQQAKPFQQKFRKMHPSLEPAVKKELNKLIATRIIFPVWHM